MPPVITLEAIEAKQTELGQLIAVELTALVLMDGSGKNSAPEMHAQVNSLQLVPKEPKSKDNPFFYDKSAAGACVVSTGSYQ